MNEINLIEKIKKTLNSKYIGDDCAYLKDLGIVMSQDSLVENVHFDKEDMTPYQLGYKAIMVNLSDIAASGAVPKYFTIAISLPSGGEKSFVKDFYSGCKEALKETDAEIVGGDITGSDEIYISVCAIGKTEGRRISSRSNAKVGYKIITTGVHGSSAAGLKILQQNLEPDTELIKAHLMPQAQLEFAQSISSQINCDYAMMDTSDGLFDALYKIGSQSGCTMSVDFERILYNPKIKEYFEKNYQDLIFFGGEDYQIVATVPVEFLAKLDNNSYTIIGDVVERTDKNIVKINFVDYTDTYSEMSDKCFNHFDLINQ